MRLNKKKNKQLAIGTGIVHIDTVPFGPLYSPSSQGEALLGSQGSSRQTAQVVSLPRSRYIYAASPYVLRYDSQPLIFDEQTFAVLDAEEENLTALS